MPPPALQTRGLCKDFRGFRAVDSVDLTVADGAVHALVGPNGAGKTTLFNLLTGFLRPTEGRIDVAGRDVTGDPPDRVARAGVARSFQISSLFDQLSLREHVELALASGGGLGWRFWRSDRLLGRHRAAALTLLDEPTAGMGAEDVARTVALVREVREGRTVVLVEHNMSVVADLADRVTVLQAGKILVEGPYGEVRQDPRVVEAYLGAGTHAHG